MSRERITTRVQEPTDLSAAETADSSRRQFLRQMAVAGAGIAGLTLLGEQSASAAPPIELLVGNYNINYDVNGGTMKIESQSGPTFVARFGDGTGINGSICGLKPGTVAIYFTRVALDGSIQMYVGGASIQIVGGVKQVFLAGTFCHNGTGSYPWSAAGTSR